MTPFLHQVALELMRAKEKHPKQNSLHEGYAVLLEEVEEFWDLVKRQTKDQDPAELLCRNGARRAWVIESSELARYARERRAPGRPGKQTSGPWWAKGRDE